MKVAIVYDRVNKIGGAERVLEALHEIWPEAPLYTAIFNPEKALWAKKFKVFPSFLNKFPFAKSTHEFYPMLTPFAFESFDFADYDVVISVTSAEAKGIITKPKTLHICYCLTPTRYLWSGASQYLENPGFGSFNFLAKAVYPFLSCSLRPWDQIAAQRPDYYVAISKTVQQRIKKYYRRESEVIYPPVDVKRFCKRTVRQSNNEAMKQSNNFFLIVSRLVPYKRIDLVVKAFNQLGLPLKIIGTGNQLNYLKRIAKKNIEFLGQLTDTSLISYYQRCTALVFPGEEDLGLTALEVQAAGKPVIAYKKGGLTETVIEGKTGIFFEKQNVKSLKRAVKGFLEKRFKQEDCIKNAQKFDRKVFIKRFKNFVEEKWQQHKKLI